MHVQVSESYHRTEKPWRKPKYGALEWQIRRAGQGDEDARLRTADAAQDCERSSCGVKILQGGKGVKRCRQKKRTEQENSLQHRSSSPLESSYCKQSKPNCT
jgi:hypothetical protein